MEERKKTLKIENEKDHEAIIYKMSKFIRLHKPDLKEINKPNIFLV